MNAVRVIALTGGFAVATLLAGCDETGNGPEGISGLAFSFSGDLSGSYLAAGTPVVGGDGQPEFGSWAIAAEADSLGGLVLAAFRPSDDPSGDLFVLQLTPLGVRVFAPCEPNADCHGRVLFGYDGGSFDHYFEITSGSVTIAEIGEGRVRGTFQFVARDEGGTGAQVITVDDGEFDVPFADTAEGNAVRCMLGSC
ncbi:MAG: hypothetical protein GTO46_15910 [Gemmatimonadetes bacterium]|nr:hypothetical protein [Gemmatimonadota bacterium]NIO33122.1 hypothetical protein [Gemmatimonadota bacterium]